MMKKLTLLFISLCMPAMLFFGSASAANIFQTCSGQASSTDVCQSVQAQNKAGGDPIISILKTVLDVVSYVAGVAAVILTIVGAIRFITSGGGPDSVKSARQTLIYVAVGIFIIAVAQTLVVFVLDRVN